MNKILFMAVYSSEYVTNLKKNKNEKGINRN
jgi:hypothetical protein